MILLILAAVTGLLAIGTYTETDWEYGNDRTIRRARVRRPDDSAVDRVADGCVGAMRDHSPRADAITDYRR